ncbi:MAG: DNA-binding protein WhiA, partial [Firmicutes bacterium]|nr:DNA-binding protein WhiA [Bacillota bacterium]
MSFSSDVKKELTTLEPGKKCCQLAEIALYLRFSGSITLSGGVGLRSSTGNPAVARYYAGLIKDYFGVKTALTVLSGAGISRGRSYELFIG